jgi:autotransporter-associated beta strand repeat
MRTSNLPAKSAGFWRTVGIGFLTVALAVPSLPAIERNWAGTSGDSWFVPGNWNPSGVPTANDEVRIEGLSTIGSAGAAAYWVRVGYFLSGGLNISSGGTLTSTLADIHQGTVNVSGSWSTQDMDIAGILAGGSGTLNIHTGGIVSAGILRAAQPVSDDVYSQGVVNVDGGTLDTQIINMGGKPRGLATLNVTNGGIVTSSNLHFAGTDTGQTNRITVSGGGSSISASESLVIVGYNSAIAPELNILDGATVTVGAGTGTLKVALGKVNIGNGGAAGTLYAGKIENHLYETPSTVNFNHTGTTTLSADITTDISVTKSGSGASILTGTNTYTGATTINAGILQIGNGGTTGTLGSGAVTNNGTLVIDRSNDLTVANTITGAGGLTKFGAGRLTLTGTNSYNGPNAIFGGGVEFSSASSLGSGSIAIHSGATLRWGAGNTADISSRLTAIDGGATFDTNGNDVWFTSGVSGTGGITKTGAGTLTLDAPSSYTGGTTISEGTLHIGTAGSIGAGNVVNNSALVVTHAFTSTTMGNNISGTGTLTKRGNGTVILSGTNTYTGDTRVEAGTLTISGSTNTGGGDLYVGYNGSAGLAINSGASLTTDFAYLGRFDGDNGTANVSGTWTAPGITIGYSGSGTLNLLEGGVINGNIVMGSFGPSGVQNILNIGTGGATGILNASTISGGTRGGTVNFNHSGSFSTGAGVSGNLAIIHSGSGTTTLSGVNTWNRGTTINSGTLVAGSSGALPNNTAYVVNGGKLDLASGPTLLTMSSLSGTGGQIVIGGKNLAVDQATSTTFDGDISGTNGHFHKQGTGILTLSGTIDLGRSLGISGGQTIVNGGTLIVDGSLKTLGVHVGENGSTGTLVVNGSVTADSFLTVGDNTGAPTTGGTGTLTIGNGGVVTLGSGAKLTVGWTNAIGTLNLESGGTLRMGGADGIQKAPSGTATVNLSGGTISVVNSALSTSLPMTLSNQSTIDTNGHGAVLSGTLSGDGSLAKTGTGELVLSGENTYTGQTTAEAGTLRVDGSLAGGVSVFSGAALSGGGSVAGPSEIHGILSPGGIDEAGLLTFGGDLTLDSNSHTDIHIGGLDPADFDRTFIGGLLDYGGTLHISLIHGFMPQIGDSFRIFDAANGVVGTFTGISISDPGLVVSFDYATGTLTVVPEPSSYALSVVGLLTAVLIRHLQKRRRSEI